MKKLCLVLLCLLSLQLSTSAWGRDVPITEKELPAQSQQVIKKYFPNQSIALVKKDTGILSDEYEVLFTNGNKIEFDGKGGWQKIDCRYTAFPQALIPQPIATYVSQNYPGVKIDSIEKEDSGRYEVSLANGLDLKFDKKFNLTGIDD